MPYGNIMYDRRIVRGNTYAQRTLPAVSVADQMKMLFVCSVLNKCMSGQNEVAAQRFLFASTWITKTEVINLFNILDFQFTYASSGLVLSASPPPPSQEKGIWVDRVNTMCFQFVIHYVNFYSYKDFFKQLKKLA